MIKTPVTKTVLITGGLSGIGREIALEFQKNNWSVWVTSRDPSKHDALPGVNIRKLDLTNQAAMKQLIKEIKSADGRVDVLINNSGYGVLGPTETISAQQARQLMDINVVAPMLLTQEVLPLMRAQKHGHVINISSAAALRALPGLGLYAASKMALEGWTEALAAEVAQWNIQVSIIQPTAVKNDWVKNALIAQNIDAYPGYKSFNDKLISSLHKRVAETGQQPKEIAELALKIASTAKPDLRYQTNSTAAALANEILIDPSGNKMRDKTVAFAQDLYGVVPR